MEVMSALIPLLAAVFAALITYVLLAARLRRQETDVVTAETRVRAESQADVARLEERIAGLNQGQMIKDEELQSLRAALGEARERLATRILQ